MGSGASTNSSSQVIGVPANPRVQYSHKLGGKENKRVLVDAPVLLDIEHGSVRYRQAGTGSYTQKKDFKGRECPYENVKGEELQNKKNYFYHTRLKNYGPESSKENEDAFKFYYVMKAPTSSRQKKIFYVYGQGWDAKDGMKVKPSETIGEGHDFAWSSKHQPNALYYMLEFDNSDKVVETEEEDKLLSDLESTPDKMNIRLSVNAEESVANVKTRVAIKLLKSAKDIHIAHDNKELREEDVIGDLRPRTEKKRTELPDNFNISLKLL